MNDKFSNIKIIIENNDGLYENEEERIIRSASTLYECGFSESIEECIKLIAIDIRGLRYKTAIIDKNGITTFIFDGPNLKKKNVEYNEILKEATGRSISEIFKDFVSNYIKNINDVVIKNQKNLTYTKKR